MKSLRQLRLPLRLSDTPYIVVDTETTGLDHEHDRLVELAMLRFECGQVTDTFETLIDPGQPIPPEASEQHHLIDQDVEDAPPLEALEEPIMDFVHDDDLVVAHNAPFDRGFLPLLGDREWVCSARTARHVWPDAPSHRNQFLRYWLGLDAPRIRSAVAHRAAGDAIVTGHVFHQALKTYEIAHPDAGLRDFLRYVASPVPINVLRFCRAHRGKALAEVPTDYFRWMLANVADLDPDLRAAIERELHRRSGGELAA